MQGMYACGKWAVGHAAVVHGWLVRAFFMLWKPMAPNSLAIWKE
jgi:hypothetical protein